MRASIPARKAAPVRGSGRDRPRTAAISAESYAARIRPASRKSMDFASAWFAMWSRAPVTPHAPPKPRPTHTTPTCSTLEYASMRLKFWVVQRNRAATAIERSPKARRIRPANAAPAARSTTGLKRRIA